MSITTEFRNSTTPAIAVMIFDKEFLNAEKWEFTYNARDHCLRVTRYAKLSRPTKRHKYAIDEKWDTWDKRGSTLRYPKEPPGDVEKAARNEFVEQLTSEWEIEENPALRN